MAALVGLAFVVDWHAFFRILRHAEPALVVLAGLAMVVDRLIVSWRWQLLLAPVGVRISFLDNWRIYSGSQAAAHVLPLDVVADALRASWVARRGPALGSVAATIVVERLLSVLVSGALSLLAVLFLGLHLLGPGLGHIATLLTLGVLAVATVSLPPSRRMLIGWLWRRRRLRRFLAMTRRLSRDREALSAASALTVLRQIVVTLANCLLAVGLGLPVDPLVFAAAFLAALLIARLPGSLGGLGVFEVALAALLAGYGVSPAEALAVALLGRVLAILALAPGLGLLAFSGVPRRAPA